MSDLLGQAHFKVVRDAGAASPRQTDIVASDGRDTYLVEAKCRKRKFDINDLDSLRSRLDRVAGSVIGVVVSWSGLTGEAENSIVNHRSQPVVVIRADEIDALCEDPRSVRRLLRSRLRRLVEDGTMEAIHVQRSAAKSATRGVALMPSSRTFALGDERSQTISLADGGYNEIVFVPELPDVDWGHLGRSVYLSVGLPVEDPDDLVQALRVLASHGWGTDATWTIQQSQTSWHGYGSLACSSALLDWEQRYASIDTYHHTEELDFTDFVDGGLLTLRADIAASSFRRVTQCELTFQLEGVPLDPHPLLQLLESLHVAETPYLRTADDEAVRTVHVKLGADVEVHPVNFIVESELNGETWVRGLVCENPYASGSRKANVKPEGWPVGLDDCSHLICDLRSWHPLAEPRAKYFIRRCESTWVGHVRLVRPIADW